MTKNKNSWENFKKVLKILEEKAIEKMIFLLNLEKLLLYIEPWKVTSDYNNIFPISGGGDFPVSPPPSRPLGINVDAYYNIVWVILVNTRDLAALQERTIPPTRTPPGYVCMDVHSVLRSHIMGI